MNKLNKIFSFKPSGIAVGKGKLLIAEPFMPDFYFKRALLLLADYSKEEGAFGLIINKKTEYTIDQISSELTNIKAEVYLGGPVQTDNLFYLHNRPDLIEDSIEITPGVYWGGDFELIKYHINERNITENNIRFYLGYSGWSPDQLESELANKSWLVSRISSKEVFSHEPDTLWKICIKKLGNDFRHWLNFPNNPQWN